MRKLLKYLIGTVVLLVVALLATRIHKTYSAGKETEIRVQTLQHCCFESLNGEMVCVDEFDQEQATVIVYFHPECDHCQYEAKEIGLHADELTSTNLILVTPDDSLQRIERFISVNNLLEVDNITVLRDRGFSFHKHFGTANIPTVFIYKNNKLLKKYSGETKIEAILAIINKN
jgi:peroxiredoxin